MIHQFGVSSISGCKTIDSPRAFALNTDLFGYHYHRVGTLPLHHFAKRLRFHAKDDDDVECPEICGSTNKIDLKSH
jgi:hypothetical protein